MAKRKSLSKKIRFEVFKRDEFSCQYCGATPPSAVLEVDHLHPVCAGGDNDINNLITACFDCNRGKGKTELTEITPTILEKSKQLEEKQEQLKQYEKLLSRKKAAITRKINQIEKVFKEYHPDYCFTEAFRLSVSRFLEQLPKDELVSSMHLACDRVSDRGQATKYFCGICWNKIKGQKL